MVACMGGFLEKEISKLNICNTLNLYKEYRQNFILGNSDLKFRNLPVAVWNKLILMCPCIQLLQLHFKAFNVNKQHCIGCLGIYFRSNLESRY